MDPTGSMGPSGISAGFPRQRRLRKRPEYLAVQGSGEKIHTRHFIIAMLRRNDAGGLGRLGVTVSKRVGNAVTRNRIKRWVREYVRQNDWLPDGVDVVVIAKQGAARLTNLADVARDLSTARGRM